MAPKNEGSTKKKKSRGAWTAEEDRKLGQFVEIHGPRRWKTVAIKSGLNRCGKSCRLRWLNYLRPNIKRGNISEAEEDLIIRLHKLLGNRWSLIAGRIPGRTDNEIKNYWNSHLSKKIKHQNQDEMVQSSTVQDAITSLVPSKSYENNFILDQQLIVDDRLESTIMGGSSMNLEIKDIDFDINDFFDFSVECLDWID